MKSMKSVRGSQQQGFTLIELVVVLVILGILAAFAIPRFIDVSTDARKSATEGLGGTVRSASAMIHALALARNVVNGPLTVEGQPVTVVNGYPAGTALGVGTAVTNLSGFGVAYAAGVATFTPVNATAPASCQVVYTEAAAGSAPTIAMTVTDCS